MLQIELLNEIIKTNEEPIDSVHNGTQPVVQQSFRPTFIQDLSLRLFEFFGPITFLAGVHKVGIKLIKRIKIQKY